MEKDTTSQPPQSSPKQRGLFKRILGNRSGPVVVTILLLIVLGLSGLYFGFWSGDHKAKEPNNALNLPDRELAAAKKEVAGVKNPKTVSDKQELAQKYLLLGQAYMNKNQPKKVIESVNKALNLQPDIKEQAWGILAAAYAEDGQKQKAIDLLQQLIDLLTAKQDPYAQQAIQGYQNKITQLKSEQL